MHICRGKALFSPRFSCSSYFGKWRHSASRFFAIFLTVALLFCAIIPSSAEDATLTLSSLTTQMQREVTEGSSTISHAYAYTEGIQMRNGQQMHWFKAQNPDFYASGGKKIVFSGGDLGLAAGHEYEFTFYTDINVSMSYNVRVLLDGNRLFDDTGLTGFKKISVKFTAPDTIRDNSRISVIYSVGSEYNFGAGGQDVRYYISENLEFFDRTDNPSWLAKIKQWFQDLGDKIGGFFGSLGDRISGFFSDLSNSISQWFAEQKQQIQDFFNGVKQWFQELGDRIQQFFVDLYNDIVEGLKKLFIPSEGYFDSKKTELEIFATEHFGAMYQAPVVMVDMIKKFTTMSPKSPAITFPAIQFDFQGTRYVLTDEIRYSFSWVNDKSHMLYYFYQFYRGFATVLMFVWFGNYCVNKYNEVFGGKSEE